VVALTASETDSTKKLAMRCREVSACKTLFKEGHLVAKRTVAAVAGKQAPNSRWQIPDGAFESLQDNKCIEALAALRKLAVAYDNFPPNVKDSVLSMSEFVRNVDSIIALAQRCLAVEGKRLARGQKARQMREGGVDAYLQEHGPAAGAKLGRRTRR